MPRTNAHVIETKSKDYIRKTINSFYDNGDALYRDLTERDYGIDAIVELFDNGYPTGKIGLLQIKSTESEIEKLKKSNYVSCQISTSNAYYALQTNIPVILIYVSIGRPIQLYYARIQDLIGNDEMEKLDSQKTICLKIPANNNIVENLEPIFELIRGYFNEEE